MRSHIPFWPVYGFVFALLAVPEATAQDSATAPKERSVKILTDAPEATSDPALSSARLELLNSNIKIDNPAGVSLAIVPSDEVVAGSRIGFRIGTKKPGYLVLLNVDSSGKLTQVFPTTPKETSPLKDVPNLVKPGKPLIIPQLTGPYSAFEFVADPPAGVAMVVALLSDKPVQVVDLPDAPPPAFAPNDTLKYVRDQALTLVVPSKDGAQMERPSWSFDGKVYLIK
jgi:hypothetical protein